VTQVAEDLAMTPTLGVWLRTARRTAGLSQADVWRTTGIDTKRLSAYENGRGKMTVTTLERLAELYKLELPWSKGRYPSYTRVSVISGPW